MKHSVKVRIDRLEKRKVSCPFTLQIHFVQTVAQSAFTLSFVDFRVNSLIYFFHNVRIKVRKMEKLIVIFRCSS